MKKVTVVIPNYNGIRFLNDCLGSLYLQEPGTPEYDVLVVDNGSRDGSVSFLREHFPQAALEILPENTGFCHAVNLGIQKSATPYVILLNNDTRVEPGFIRRLCAAIEQDPRIFSVSVRQRKGQAGGAVQSARGSVFRLRRRRHLPPGDFKPDRSV